MQNAAGAEQQPDPASQKKVKISFEEYQRLAFMIIHIMKEYERTGDENVRQGDIIEKMVQKIELENPDRQTSIERSLETSKKVQNVIGYLINNENILMITQDARSKNDRFLTLNVNVDFDNLAAKLGGSKEQNY